MKEYKQTNNSSGLRVLSLCGGIETGLLALLQLGIPVAEYHTYEILPEAIAVSRHHFPWIVHHGDMIGADFTQFKGFDLILAGTCCQSLSKVRIEDKHVNSGLAGKSGIFYEAVRAVEEVKPRWFMFENVVPSSVEDLYIMNECLGVDGVLINSNRFSAQDRERYYWTNFEINPLPESNTDVLKDIMQKNVEEKYFYKKTFSNVDMDKKVCATLDVKSMEMNRRIYNPDFKCCTLTCINGGYHDKKVMDGGRPRKLTEIEYERLQGLPDDYTGIEINGKKLSYSKRCSLCGNGWNLPTVKHILGSLK